MVKSSCNASEVGIVKKSTLAVTPKLDAYLDEEYGEAIVENTLEQALQRGCTLFSGRPWRPYMAHNQSIRTRTRIFH